MKSISIIIYLISISNCLYTQVNVSLSLEKGRSYYFSSNNKITIIESTGKTEARTVNTEKGSFSYTVLEDLDSLYLMETQFIHLSIKVETDSASTFSSSDINDLSDVASTMLSRIINKPFRVLMRKDYNWKEVYGLDSVFFNSYKDYNLSDDVRKQVDIAMKESMKGFTRQDDDLSAVMYGSKKIKADEVWTSSYITEHIVPTYDSCTYYLAETNGDFLVVKGTGTVSSFEDEKITGESSTAYHLKGTTEVTVKYFKNSFWINEAVVKTEITGDAEIKDTPLSDKRKIPMKIITEATISGHL